MADRLSVGPTTWKVMENDWWYSSRSDLIASLAPSGPLTLIDVGCGRGDLILLSAEDFHIGVDGYRDQAWEISDNRCFVIADVTQLPFKELSADIVTSLDVIEHCERDDNAVRELERVTKTGGELLLMVPAGSYLWSQHDVEVGHYRRYNRASLLRLLPLDRLEILKLSYFFAWLVLPALVRKLLPRTTSSKAVGGTFSRVAKRLCGLEQRFITGGRMLPFGTSLFVHARKNPLDRR
jgi:SAM-dependent methyltransferase